MECPKCKRKQSVKRSTCLYCGAPLDGAVSNHKSHIYIQDNKAVIVDEKRTKNFLTDLEESDLQKLKDAIGEDKDVVIEKSQTQLEEISSSENDDPKISLPLEKTLTVLDKMKASYDDGHIEYGNYKKMVMEMIKDFISTLDNNVMVNFVVNEISASELADYLDDGMLKELRAFVISSVSDSRNT